MLRFGRFLAAALLLVSAVATGCGDGYSDEDATTFCDQERAALQSGCMTDAAYAQCKSCYVECGPACDRSSSCPESYACRAE
jgi:hypothetical protein